ncbi:MAG: T9SS type A sorting domain-containing protein, partial [Bacteroidota bacterium]
LSGYSEISIEFYFYPNSMENGEDFWVRYYNGSSWTTVATYASGSSFTNGQFYVATVTLNAASYNFSSNSGLRFQCDASANADQVYIDAVTVTATAGSLVIPGAPIVTIEAVEDQQDDNTPEVAITQPETETATALHSNVHIFPNPAQDVLNVRSHSEMQTIRVVSAAGQVMQQLQVEGEQKAIDISQLNPGLYYLLIEVDGEMVPQRFVKH